MRSSRRGCSQIGVYCSGLAFVPGASAQSKNVSIRFSPSQDQRRRPELAAAKFGIGSSDENAADSKDPSFFLAALKACSSLRNLEIGRKIDSDLCRSVEWAGDTSITNAVINMYAKCGSMDEAQSVFDSMAFQDVVSWNSLTFGYAVNGKPSVALQLLSTMEATGCCKPNARTFLAALVACSSLAEDESGNEFDGKSVKVVCLEKAMEIHSKAASYGCEDIYVATTLISLYSKCGSMLEARRVFQRMPQYNVVSWSSLIQGFAENDESEAALQHFESMRAAGIEADERTFVAVLIACSSLATREEGKQVDGRMLKTEALKRGLAIHSQITCQMDMILASALVNFYAKCGSLAEARSVFDKMLRHDVISWNTLILGYVENDVRTVVAVLMACGSLAAKEEGKDVGGKLVKIRCLEKGMEIHSQAARSDCNLNDEFVASSLVDMYSKCGSMVDAQRAFDRMARHDVVSWTALILGYAESGDGEQALELFSWMEESCAPNALTFVAALVACGNLAMLENGRRIPGEIYRFGFETNSIIGSSLVDFYGKCGNMDYAEQAFISIQKKSLVTWSALIAGYARQGSTSLVFQRFWEMMEEGVQPNGITILSVLTACSHAGFVEKGKKLFEMMSSQFGVKREIDHFHCMVDILSRANFLEDAVNLARTMPFEGDALTWNTILGGCCKWKNLELGKLAFESLIRIDDNQPAAYVLMGNICGSAGLWEERAKLLAKVSSNC